MLPHSAIYTAHGALHGLRPAALDPNGNYYLIDWLLTVLRSAQEFSPIWRRYHCRWRAAKSRSMLGAQGLWAGRDLYRATPAVTRDLGLSGLIRRTTPFSRLLRHTRGCGGPILTRILTWVIITWVGCLYPQTCVIRSYAFSRCLKRCSWRIQVT
jgi:hypothetical protein